MESDHLALCAISTETPFTRAGLRIRKGSELSSSTRNGLEIILATNLIDFFS
jgi:hypothetical protein